MTPRVRVVLLSAVLAAVGTVAYLSFADEGSPPARDPGPVIARVDGAPIYLADAQARIRGVASVHEDIRESLGEDWPDAILRSLVDDVIIRREAAARGIRLDDEEIQASVDQVRADFATDEAFQRWLSEQGMDVAELQRRLELNMLAARIYLAVTEDVTVSGEEIRAYYDRHRSDFVSGDRQIPLLEVRVDIRATLQKKEEDRAFGEWLDSRRESVDLVVVDDDWWRSVR